MRSLAVLACLAVLLAVPRAFAQTPPGQTPPAQTPPIQTPPADTTAPETNAADETDAVGPTRADVKCQRYRAIWADLLARRGRAGLGAEFLGRHEAFLASGCEARPDVCPRSEAELAVANALVIAAMNAGAPSTFLPFACRR